MNFGAAEAEGVDVIMGTPILGCLPLLVEVGPRNDLLTAAAFDVGDITIDAADAVEEVILDRVWEKLKEFDWTVDEDEKELIEPADAILEAGDVGVLLRMGSFDAEVELVFWMS